MVGASTRWCLSPKTCPSAPCFKKQNVHRGQEALEPLELELQAAVGSGDQTLREQQVLLKSEPSLRLLHMISVFSTTSRWDVGS